MVDEVPSTLEMKDCIQGTAIGGVVGKSQLILAHGGDQATLVCPATMSEVVFHIVKTTARHSTGSIWPHKENKVDKSDATLKTGETKAVGPVVEQVSSTESLPDAGLATGSYIDDVNIIVNIKSAKDLSGKPPSVPPAPITYTWEIVDSDGKVLSTGVELTQKAAKTKVQTYAADHKNDVWNWSIKDDADNEVESGVNKPSDAFPWVWVAVAVAVIAVVAVILLLYMRSGHSAPAGVPAAAPVPAVTIIQPPAVA